MQRPLKFGRKTIDKEVMSVSFIPKACTPALTVQD
jgi:hypothetical protein